MAARKQTTAYGQLASPISTGSGDELWRDDTTVHRGTTWGSEPAEEDPWWAAADNNHHNADDAVNVGIGRIQLGATTTSQPTSQPKSKSRGTTSKLAERRKSHEKVPSLYAPEHKEPEPAGSDGHRASWEPVSPGILDRSPEVAATRKQEAYYWPSGSEAVAASRTRTSVSDAKESARSGSSTSSGSSSSSSSSSGGGGGLTVGGTMLSSDGMSRRGSKAAEFSFPLHGLEQNMLDLTGKEFRGLLKSALRANDVTTARRLLTTPLPESAGTIQCFVRRNKSGLMNTFYPSYECFLEEPDAPVFLMSSKKRTKNRTSNFAISLLNVAELARSKNDANMTSDNPSYLGKLRSNFVGSEYVGYDAGINPKTFIGSSSHMPGSSPTATGLSRVRQELCAVSFTNNILSRCQSPPEQRKE